MTVKIASPASRQRASVYFLCPERATPVGGVRVIYRHVDILNKHGIPAFVVHETPGFRTRWFANDTPIVYSRRRWLTRLGDKFRRRFSPDAVIEIPIQGGASPSIRRSDILVIPELYGPDLSNTYGRGIKKVILNQNCYLTFHGYSFDPSRKVTPYGHPDILATMVNSVDGEDYLKYVFPNAPIFRFRLSIDLDLFRFIPNKTRQICFSQIKNRADAMQVINLLKFRGALDDCRVVPFINRPQIEVASILGESLVFLSFGYPEGFGLPAAEAMASGCVVVGFHGGGGREFFRTDFCYPIAQGDIVGFAKTVEAVLQEHSRDPIAVTSMGRRAADFIRSEYSPALEEAELLEFWSTLLSRFDS